MRKFRLLSLLLIVALIVPFTPVAASAPAVSRVEAPATAPAAELVQAPAAAAQFPPQTRTMPAHVVEADPEILQDLSIEQVIAQYGYVPHALENQVKGESMMMVVELEQAPLAVYYAEQKAAGKRLTAAAMTAYVNQLGATQATVQGKLEALGVKVVADPYVAAYNGFLAYVPLEQVNAILALEHVKAVYRAPEHTLALGSSVPLIGADAVWQDPGYDGTGVVIAIIDSGIDYTHAVFGGSGDPAVYDANDPDVIEAGTFPTAKVIGGYDFAGTTYNADDSDEDLYQPIPYPDRDPLDEGDHGTHVASIAAGMAAGQVMTGTAPGAKLMALKVFGAEGSTNLVMNAVDMATYSYLLNGWPHVINMSLGSSYGPGNHLGDPDIVATNNAVSAGIVVAVSSGNSGNIIYSNGSPGNADKSISVAGSSTGWVTGPTVNVASSAVPTLTNVIYGTSAFSPDGHYLTSMTAPLVYAGSYSSPILCLGSTVSPTNAFSGTIVLIERGSCAFTEKVRTAKSFGAAGVLIYNSAAGGNTYITMADDGLGGLIPAGFLARQDGLNLRTASGQTVTVSAENEVTTVADRYTPPNSVYPSSSRGPRGTDSKLKPEIAAPGYNIFAALRGTGDEGASFSGTSMAAPHIAGVAALMVQAHPDWTPEQIKAAMMNTAIDMVDGTYIPRQGAGVVQADKAVKTPVVVVGEEDFVAISEMFTTSADEYVIGRDVTLYNMDTVSRTLDVSWDYQGASLEGLAVEAPAQVVVAPESELTIPVTFTFDATMLPAVVGYMEEIYGYLFFTLLPTPQHTYTVYLPLILGGAAAGTTAVQPQVLMASEDALRVPFYFVPRPYTELEIEAQTVITDVVNEMATFAITQTGPISSSLFAFPWLVSDPLETFMPGDIRAVGIDYGWNHSTLGPILSLAINTWAPWHLPHYYFAEFDIWLDVNEDGTDDYVIYNAPVAGTNSFIPTIVNLSTGTARNSNYYAYVDFNSGYMEMYVPAAYLGMGVTNTNFDFQVVGWDGLHNSDPTAPSRFDYAHYPLGWGYVGATDDYGMPAPGPGAPDAMMGVWVNDLDGYLYSEPEGVMLVDYTGDPYFGGETYLFPLDVHLPLDLTILHTNDFHARVDEYDVGGGACTTPANCIGGYSRLSTLIQGVRAETDNVLLVDAGDQFQGTLYYNLFKSEVIAKGMNALGYDAMTIGNHEFDDGPDELAMLTYRAGFPVIGTNLNVEDEPALVGRIPTYHVIARSGQQIGILGVTTPELPEISSPGPNVVVEDPATSVQAAVDELHAMGVNKIVLLSHLGYAGDQALAAAVSGVDVIVGGHSHTFLYDPATPQNFISPTLALTPAGPYPTVVDSLTDEPVLIVTAFEWGKFLGRLDVSFDGYGVLTAYDGNPIYVNNTVAKDAAIETMLTPYRAEVSALMTLKIGEITVDAPINVGGKRICRLGECLLGNLVTDAMLWQINEVGGGDYQIALTNGGGLRAALAAGDVTYGGVMSVLPFGNTIATMELKGEYLLAALEHSVRLYPSENGGFLQVSGMRYHFDPTRAAGSRIVGAEVWNEAKMAYEPLNLTAMYKVVTNNFTRNGGDGYTWFRDNAVNAYDFGPGLHEAVIEYFKTFSPVTPVLEDRINKLDTVITILHTNDTHGNWVASQYGGMERVATLVKQQRALNPNTILVDGGDTFQGNAFAYFFKDRPDNPIAGGLNLMGYDAMTIGNHEYNFGPTTFVNMLGQLDFPLLGAANVDDDGSYGLADVDAKEYVTMTVAGKDVVLYGLTNPRVPRYELPSNIVGLTFHPATETASVDVPAIIAAEDPDLFIAVNHIGYQPYGGEVDSDQLVAEGVAGIDVIIGSHSHTLINPAVMVKSAVNPNGTLIAQAERYANWLGVVNVGYVGDRIVYRGGHLISARNVEVDADLHAYLAPYFAEIDVYNATPVGQTSVPIDALQAYTQETNGANLQTDAAVWALAHHPLNPITVDFHLSGAMSNRKIAPAATVTNPVTITKGDLFNLMPYENSLVVMELNGVQLKEILERGYRNYWYYKYQANATPKYGGYSYYTTCMLDISAGGIITYTDPGAGTMPDGNNVVALSYNGMPVHFTADYTYTVSSVNYIVAGSCNFNNSGDTIWPLDQIVYDSQVYVRDSVIDYVPSLPSPIAPAIEGRLRFVAP